jgi:hypothetical protein
LLLVICLTSMSFGFFDIAEIWKAQRDSRHLLLLLLLLCWALSCYFKVLSWRLSFSCYRQSVVVVENFFLSCGLPSKCVVVVENEFLSLLWVTYLPMICFQRFQLSSIWYTDVGGMNNLTTNALWIAHLCWSLILQM